MGKKSFRCAPKRGTGLCLASIPDDPPELAVEIVPRGVPTVELANVDAVEIV